MIKTQAELLIRDMTIKTLKNLNGKGPKTVTVKITKNYIIIECKEVLTSMEKKLLNTENGFQQILDIHKGLEQMLLDELEEQLKQLVRTSVIEFMSKLSIMRDELYMLLLLEEDLEEKYN